MRIDRRFGRALWIAFVFIVYSNVSALAQCPPPIQQDGNGLTGPINLPSATLSIMDKSYLQSGLPSSPSGPFTQRNAIPNVNPAARREQLRQHLRLIDNILPKTIVGLAVQFRSYSNGPTYYSPELSIGSYLAAVDFTYQRFEGGLNGDGIGLRFSPFALATEYSQQLRRLIRQRRKIAEDISKIDAERPHLFNNSNILSLTSENILADIKLNSQSQLSIDEKTLIKDVASVDDIVFPDVDTISQYYADAVLATNVAFVGGYRTLNVGKVTDFGISVSQLWIAGKPNKNNTRPAILTLFSAQAETVDFARQFGGQHANILQYGFGLAFQNRVAWRGNPRSRWDFQAGLEFTAKTRFDSSPTYGGFVRLRPMRQYKQNAQDPYAHQYYAPIEFDLFGGIGPNSQPFGGVRVGVAFAR